MTNASLRQLGLGSREATTALTDLVERQLARSWGGRRYAQYALHPAVSTSREAGRPPEDTPTPAEQPQPGVVGARVPRNERLRQTRALLLAATRPLSASEIAVRLGVGERSVLTYLTELIALGRLSRQHHHGALSGAMWRRRFPVDCESLRTDDPALGISTPATSG